MYVVGLTFLAFAAAESPVTRVVEMISGLKAKIQTDGKVEQAVYDKFACWCEKTTASKAGAIEDAKVSIEDLSKSILERKGRLGSFMADVSFLKKNIAEKSESITTSTEMRKKENEEYVEKKSALELAIANLNKAISTLKAGSTEPTKGFKDAGLVETKAIMETRMLSVTAEVRNALSLYSQNSQLTMQDQEAMNSFLSSPVALVQSPHKGTYQTQSGAIQGILADMYDSFRRELASAIEEETEKASDFAKLDITNKADLALLKKNRNTKELGEGNDVKDLATEQKKREETQKQLDADEAFFETTKESCKAKADEWAERSRLRTEELAGMNQAIDILTSDDASSTFATADSTFIQMSALRSQKAKAKHILDGIAGKSGSKKIKKIAELVQMKGDFPGVEADIVRTIEDLRKEEQEDIDLKAWCEGERSKSAAQNEQLEYDKTMSDNSIKRKENHQAACDADIKKTEQRMADLQEEMDNALDNRNAQNKEFKDALKADTDAVMLLAKTIEALSKYYVKNGLGLVQKRKKHAKKHHASAHKQDPEYTTSEFDAPSADFSSSTSSSSENSGIVSIIENIKEDLEKEMETSKKDESESFASYRKMLKESADSMQAMKDKVISLKEEIADTGKKIEDEQDVWNDLHAQKQAVDAYLDSIKEQCDWIMSNFDSRATARKEEMEGLDDAKSALAGGAEGSFVVKHNVVTKTKESVADQLKELDATERSYKFLQK
jgi:hypothetical protein